MKVEERKMEKQKGETMMRYLFMLGLISAFTSPLSFADHANCECSEQCSKDCESGHGENCKCKECDCAKSKQCNKKSCHHKHEDGPKKTL